ncbi:MAG: polysaccharide deacetylase family protein [Cyanobacteria bacterium J06559_3]
MLILLIVLAVGLLGLLIKPPQWLFTRVLSPVVCPGAVYAVNTSAKRVALTIDDGPDLRLGEANSTQKILAILRRHNQQEPAFPAHATFFLISNQVQERAMLQADRQDAVVVQMIADGHEIGNHLLEDIAAISLGDRFSQAFTTAHERLTPYAQQPNSPYPQVSWFRPGVGWCDRAMADAVSQQAEYQSPQGFPNIALGSVWPYDTVLSWPAFSRWFIRHTVRPGAIIILHDSGSRGDNTVQILEELLQDLASQGYTAVPLTDLLANGDAIARSQVLPKPIEAVRKFLIIQRENLRLRPSGNEG